MFLGSGTPVGLQIADDRIRLILFGSRSKETVRELPLPAGIVKRGEVTDLKKYGMLLSSFIQKNIKDVRKHEVILLLPPDRVYGALFHVPSKIGVVPAADLERVFPVEISELSSVSNSLGKHGSDRLIAVVGVRTSLLAAHLEACAASGLDVTAVTTFPVLLETLVHRHRKDDSFLLVSGPVYAGNWSTTLFHRRWPIDESILFGKDFSAVSGEVRQLLTEYADSFPPSFVATAGVPSAQRQTLQESVADAGTKAASKKDREFLPLEKMVPTPSNPPPDEDGILQSFRPKVSSLEVNLLPHAKRKHPARRLFFLLLLTAAAAAFSIFVAIRYWPHPHSQKPEAALNAIPCFPAPPPDFFIDISASHPRYLAIHWGSQTGFLKGYPDGAFRAEGPITRAELLKVLIASQGDVTLPSASGTTVFPDVTEHDWFAPYVLYAKDEGIASGYADATFKPNNPVTFAEGLKMAYEAWDIPVNPPSADQQWYEPYVNHALGHEYFTKDELDPLANMQRQDVAWLAWKVVAKGQGFCPQD